MGVVALIIGVVSDREVKWSLLWILLLLAAMAGIFGFARTISSSLGRDKADTPPPPRVLQGSALWFVFALLASPLLVALGWLIFDGDGSAGAWILIPLGLVALAMSFFAEWTDHELGYTDRQVRPPHAYSSIFLLGLVAILLLALLLWFVGGTRELKPDTPAGSVAVEEVDQPEVPDEPEAPEVTAEPDVPDDPTPPASSSSVPDEVVEEPAEPESEFDPELGVLVQIACLDLVDGPPLTMDHLVSDYPIETGPVAGETPGRATTAPGAVEIEYAGLVMGGCDSNQHVVIAHHGGPPTDAQLEFAIDYPGTAGRAPDPNAPGPIGRAGGWEEIVIVEGGELTQYDQNFAPIDLTVLFYESGDYAMFVVPVSADMPNANFIYQSFFRDGSTDQSPIAWSSVTLEYMP